MRERQIERNIKRKTKPRNKIVKTPTIVKTMKTYLLLTKPPVKVHEFKQKDIILKWIDCQIMPVCSDSMSGKNKKVFFPEKTINFVYKKCGKQVSYKFRNTFSINVLQKFKK